VQNYVESLEREKAHNEKTFAQQKSVLESRLSSEEEELHYLKNQVSTLKEQIASNRSAKAEFERANDSRVREFETEISAKEREADKLSRQVGRQVMQIQELENRGEERVAEHRTVVSAIESELGGLKLSSREMELNLASAQKEYARHRDDHRGALDEVLAENDRLKQELRVAEAKIAHDPTPAPGSDQSLATQLRSEVISLETKSANLERIKNELTRNHEAQVFKFSEEIEDLKTEREAARTELEDQGRKLALIGGEKESALARARSEIELLRGNLEDAIQGAATTQETADQQALEHDVRVEELLREQDPLKGKLREAEEALASEKRKLEESDKEKATAVTKVQAEVEKLLLELRDNVSNADAAQESLEERARFHESRSEALREERDRLTKQSRELQDKLSAARRDPSSGTPDDACETIERLESELSAAKAGAPKAGDQRSEDPSLLKELDKVKAAYKQAQGNLEAEQSKIDSATREARAEIQTLKKELTQRDESIALAERSSNDSAKRIANLENKLAATRTTAPSSPPAETAAAAPPRPASAPGPTVQVQRPAASAQPEPLPSRSLHEHELKNLGIVPGKALGAQGLRLEIDTLPSEEDPVVLKTNYDEMEESNTKRRNLAEAEAALKELEQSLGVEE